MMNHAELENQLQLRFDSIISPRRPLEGLTTSIDGLDADDQAFTLHWIEVIASSNLELAYHFGSLAAKALSKLTTRGTRAWVLNALGVYDDEGLYPAIKVLDALDSFAIKHRQQQSVVSFSDIQGHLSLFIQGLSGRKLKLDQLKPESTDAAYTDTQTLFLPQQINRFSNSSQNRKLYKAQTVFLWAQSRYGTFKRSNQNAPSLWQRLGSYSEPAIAEVHFLRLESIRLMAIIRRELPGLHREMQQLSPLRLPSDSTWIYFQRQLETEGATVETTFLVLDELLKLGLVTPPGYLFQGRFALHETEEVMQSRQHQELATLKEQIQTEQLQKWDEQALLNALANQAEADNKESEPSEIPGEGDDGNTVPHTLPPQLRALVDSLLQDFDQLPNLGALDDIPDGDSNAPHASEANNDPLDIEPHSGKQFFFDEWDTIRQSYRENWCRVIEREVPVTNNAFRQRVINKYPHLVKTIQCIFDGIRDEPVLHKKQTDGEEIDIDAVVDSAVDRLSGQEISDRLYLRKNHHERSIAVCILVDISGSTKGWINEAERESLILICEALDRLDDRYAIFAFSGMTHERCEIYPLKRFDQPNDTDVQAQIGGLAPRYYTRMGAAIRYANDVLAEEVARHRILLVLSDGKPDDYDGYKGDYGIEDSRKALIEGRTRGIRPFCITIDSSAADYSPHLFGENGYTLLKEVSSLPLKIADIYRRLSEGA